MAKKKKTERKYTFFVAVFIKFLFETILPDTGVSRGDNCWNCGIMILSKDDDE